MPVHRDERVLPYTATQLFDLVLDVGRYPEFLPWCLAARVFNREESQFDADLLIGFKMIREHFGSRVSFEAPHHILVEPTRGPFRRMTNRWQFTDLADGACKVDFFVDFAFRSRLLNKLIGTVYLEAVRRMVAAFEGRARDLYGSNQLVASPAREPI